MFKDYDISPALIDALAAEGFTHETEIQKAVLPLALSGKTVLGKSATGTGKTLAYLVPILSRLTNEKNVQAAIITPTRELAFQVSEVLKSLTRHLATTPDIRLYCGGTDQQAEEERLGKSQPQIVIGTIGRLGALSARKHLLRLDEAKMLVVDEADMVLEDPDITSLDAVFGLFPKELQILVFSATFSKQLIAFSNRYLARATVVDLTTKDPLVGELDHYFLATKAKDKVALLVEFLHIRNPYFALVFTNTKDSARMLSERLGEAGFSPVLLSGDVPPRERRQALKAITGGHVSLVVATDLAARGMDFPDVSDVINFELPEDVEYYIHRVGRTARNTKGGACFSFYDFQDERYLEHLKERHITGIFVEIKSGEIKRAKRHVLATRKKNTTILEQKLHYTIPLGKVKPGYKKKRNAEIHRQVRHLEKQNIRSVYRRKAHEAAKGNDHEDE